MNMIKVLHFAAVINENDFIDNILRHINKNKYEKYALSDKKACNIKDPSYHSINIEHIDIRFRISFLGLIKSSIYLRKIIKKNQIDLVHSHHFYETLIAFLALFPFSKRKLIFGRHYHDEFYHTANGLKLKIYLFIEKILMINSAAIVVPTDLIREFILQNNVLKTSIYVIPYGFNFENEKYKKLSNVEINGLKTFLNISDSIVIANVARHVRLKGILDLLQSFSEVKKSYNNLCLLLVGDGPFSSELKNWVFKHNLTDSVKFLGWSNLAMDYIQIADIVVHPSYQEAFPQIMIETLYFNKPLIITPVSGTKELSELSSNIHIVNFQSPSEITFHIKKLLSKNNFDEVSNAPTNLISALSISNLVKRIDYVYDTVLNKI
jgi:glycosyltransferase involved in cell wall biosynthesis